MRNVKTPTLCQWPDGSASTRNLIHSDNPSEIEVYYMHADSTILHRSDGGPARVIVSANTHMPVLVLWCENDTWSQRRLAAGLPTCFDENYFEWIEHTGNHNPNGPAVVYNDGDYAYHIKSVRVSTERFGEQYMTYATFHRKLRWIAGEPDSAVLTGPGGAITLKAKL